MNQSASTQTFSTLRPITFVLGSPQKPRIDNNRSYTLTLRKSTAGTDFYPRHYLSSISPFNIKFVSMYFFVLLLLFFFMSSPSTEKLSKKYTEEISDVKASVWDQCQSRSIFRTNSLDSVPLICWSVSVKHIKKSLAWKRLQMCLIWYGNKCTFWAY